MKCIKCGAELQENVNFCPVCGNTVEKKAEVTEVKEKPEAETAQNVETSEIKAEIPVKTEGLALTEKVTKVFSKIKTFAIGTAKKVSLKLLITAVASVAVVTVACVNFAWAGNTVRKLFLSPEKYFASVVVKNGKELSSVVSAYYNEFILESSDPSNNKFETSVKVELGSEAREILSKLDDDYGELKNISVKMSRNTTEKGTSLDANLNLNSTSLLSLKAMALFDEQMGYLRIPEISDRYLSFDISDHMPDSFYGVPAEDYSESLSSLEEVLKAAPSQKDVEKLINKYIKVAIETYQGVKMSSKELRASGVSEKVTLLKGEMTQYDMAKMYAAVLETAINDEDLKEILRSVYDVTYEYLESQGETDVMDFDEYYESFLDTLEDDYEDLTDLMEDLEDADPQFMTSMTYKVYVDSQGTIRGLEIELPFTSKDTVYINAACPKKGSNLGVNIEVTYENTYSSYDWWYDEYYTHTQKVEVTLQGSGKESHGKISGDFTVGIDGQEFNITTDDFDFDRFKKGSLKGKFTLKGIDGDMASDISDELEGVISAKKIRNSELVVDADLTSRSGELVTKLVVDGDTFVTLSVDYSSGRASSVSAPSASKCIEYEDEDSLEDYCETMKTDKLIKSLNKAGVPSEYVDMLEDILDELEDGNLEVLEELL